MRVTVYLSDDRTLDIEDFEDASTLDLMDTLETPQRFLTFEMDGATIIVNRDHVVRIDFETA